MAKYRLVIEARALHEQIIDAPTIEAAGEIADQLLDMGDWGNEIWGAGEVDIYSLQLQEDQ